MAFNPFRLADLSPVFNAEVKPQKFVWGQAADGLVGECAVSATVMRQSDTPIVTISANFGNEARTMYTTGRVMGSGSVG